MLPVIDPPIKLIPIKKLIGNLTDSPRMRFTTFLLELFCIPTTNSKNKERLKARAKITFFKVNGII